MKEDEQKGVATAQPHARMYSAFQLRRWLSMNGDSTDGFGDRSIADIRRCQTDR